MKRDVNCLFVSQCRGEVFRFVSHDCSFYVCVWVRVCVCINLYCSSVGKSKMKRGAIMHCLCFVSMYVHKREMYQGYVKNALYSLKEM